MVILYYITSMDLQQVENSALDLTCSKDLEGSEGQFCTLYSLPRVLLMTATS